MTRKKSPFNFDKTVFGFNLTERGVKSYSKTFKLGPFSQTINVNLENGKVRRHHVSTRYWPCKTLRDPRVT